MSRIEDHSIDEILYAAGTILRHYKDKSEKDDEVLFRKFPGYEGKYYYIKAGMYVVMHANGIFSFVEAKDILEALGKARGEKQ
ncbi:MAG: hypothetical protein IKS20_12955 [Victivallales bacterium]|nr:hypothetical protein [Victivallales bacterium]